MPCRFAPPRSLMLMLSILVAGSDAAGQQSQVSSRGPRFLSAAWSSGGETDASAAPVLRRRVSLGIGQGTIEEALKEITRQADLEIFYSPRVVPLNRIVSLQAHDITVAAALTEILLEVPVDVSVTDGGGLALVPRRPVARVPIDTGTVLGQVSDSGNGSPLAGATVSIEGSRRSVVTDPAGRYRIGGLAAGTYTVRARYIGYRASLASAIVRADQEVVVDFRLGKSAQQLEEMVTTGTGVPTEVKALPTPITVLNESDIAAQQPRNINQLLRQAVPTSVGWDDAANPYNTFVSVRGATTLDPGGAQVKVFLDGIEVADRARAPVDPNSIERIEVIRGPQAAAIYGSDAIGGVVQIFTKGGDPNLSRPQVDAEAAFGITQTPYDGYGGVLRQSYTASVRGGSPNVNYSFGAGHSRTGDYLPEGEISKQSNPRVYGHMRFTRGIISADVSGRYNVHNAGSVFDPALLQSGFVPFSRPQFTPIQTQNQTLSARIELAPTESWRNVLTMGVDRISIDQAQARPRLTTPSDTLLFVFVSTQSKASIGFSSSVEGALASTVSGSFIAGFDHSSSPSTFWLTTGAGTTTGTIRTASGQPVSASRATIDNTGYFGQAQVGFRNSLFFTVGLRAEQNSEFGDSLGTPVSPRAGVSYAQQLGGTTFKLRASAGRAIRAPRFGQKLASATPTNVNLPAPNLGPERQQGWDTGVDVVFGGHGGLSVTYYHQTAENLIDRVLITNTPILTYQNQNVGRVRNTGLEVEGTVNAGLLQIRGQYGYTLSRIQQLAPGYTGRLRIGDQSLVTPKHTAGATLSLPLRTGTAITAGFAYVGSWTNVDLLAQFRCFGGTGPCQSNDRDYLVAYPGFVKVNASVTQKITRFASGFVSVDNLTNNQAHEFNNFNPVLGRLTTVGFRFRY